MSGEARDSYSATPEGFDSWSGYWTSQGMSWRTEPEIDNARKAYLSVRRGVKADIVRGIYPFRDEQGSIKLTRADVEWLLATHKSGGMRGPLDWNDTNQRSRTGLDVRGADLSGINLNHLPLDKLRGGLSEDDFFAASLPQLQTAAVRLTNASLVFAQLQRSILTYARLEGADLRSARLEGADLYHATLASDKPASLRRVSFDEETVLNQIALGNARGVGPYFSDIRWNGAVLTGVDWSLMTMTAEEDETHKRGIVRRWNEQATRTYRAAVRTSRQLATILRSQGINEDADRFAYKAIKLQRHVLFHQRHYNGWAFSFVLDALSGYGYRLTRILIAYAFFVTLFAVLYLTLSSGCEATALLQVMTAGAHCAPSGHTYSWLESFVISVTAFHGRVFVEGYQPGTPFGIVAALESIVGLVIEGVFIAMLTQRFFAR